MESSKDLKSKAVSVLKYCLSLFLCFLVFASAEVAYKKVFEAPSAPAPQEDTQEPPTPTLQGGRRQPSSLTHSPARKGEQASYYPAPSGATSDAPSWTGEGGIISDAVNGLSEILGFGGSNGGKPRGAETRAGRAEGQASGESAAPTGAMGAGGGVGAVSAASTDAGATTSTSTSTATSTETQAIIWGTGAWDEGAWGI